MSKGYEERYLMLLLSSVMNKKTAPEPIRQLDWEKIFRLSDYHHVAHVVYYGIMGLDQNIPGKIQKRFFDKYLEAVFRTERLQAAEKEILTLMERGGINGFLLSYSNSISCYPIDEMCCLESIEIGLDKREVYRFERILEEADFEKRPIEEWGCHCYYRVPGNKVSFYDNRMFFCRPMRKYYKTLLSTLPYHKGCRTVREMTLDDKYLFLICRLTDSYAKGEISLNQIIEFWVFYRKYAENLSWSYIYKKLKKFKIEYFTERLEHLIIRWFGTGVGIENTEIYEAMESYIITKGVEGREVSSKLLPLIKRVADCYARDRRVENLKKLIKWTFPDRRYMQTIYPALERLEILLPLFWLIRLVRYMIRYTWHVIERKLLNSLKLKIQGLEEKLPFLKKLKKEAEEERKPNMDDEEDETKNNEDTYEN